MVRGRKPLASAIKEASGAFLKDPQRRNKQEPKGKRGYPTKPDIVVEDPVASRCWDAVCKTLDELRILTTADVYLLEQYCVSYSMWKWLASACKEGKVTMLTSGGTPTSTPEAIQVHKYADRILKMQSELGLTPSARSRLHVLEEKEEDPFETWMNS